MNLFKCGIRQFSSFNAKCDYYSRLGLLDVKCTHTEIKKKYYELAKRYHPDSVTSLSKEDEEKFKLITEAYEILSDPKM